MLYKIVALLEIWLMLTLKMSAAQEVSSMDTLPQASPVPSQKNNDPLDDSLRYKLNAAYLKSYWTDLKYTVGRPAHWQKKDWVKFGGIMTGIGGLMLADKTIKSVALANQNNFSNSIANTVEPFGNFYGLYLFPAVYAGGLVTKNEKMQHIGLAGGKSLVISTVVYTAAKKLIRRRRPDATQTPFDYALPFSKRKYTSSPSGHTNTIFTVATAIALEFPEKKWVAPVVYSLASVTAASRIYHNRHWASDVLMGAALGHFVTKAVYASSHKKKRMLRVP
ncbi:phosphatase PAP2 family protein [Niabella insulamsoli]|uniref:phosphatase PAP2 family protein n=1 Tax=Niabella insulamsoli TaxID=3144874 RepID=UPI0031FDBEA8